MRRIRNATLTFLTLAVAGAADAAPAGPSEPDGEPQMSRDEVIWVEDDAPPAALVAGVATRFPVSIELTPASVSVVPRGLFREQGAIILGDALGNVSGVGVHTGNGVHDYFTIRGFDSLSGGLVLTDGAVEPEASFYNLYNVSRVEVLKGPASFLYGGNPLAGAVNLVREQPQFENFTELELGVGRFDSIRGSADVNLGEIESPVAFRLNATWQDTRGYRDDRDGALIAVNPALTWRVSDDSSLGINFEYADSENHPDAGLPVLGDRVAEVDSETSYASPFDASNQGITRFRIDWETRLSDTLRLQNKLYYNRLDWDTRGTLLLGVLPRADGLDVLRTLTDLDDDQRILGNRFEALASLGGGGVTHELLMGFELMRQTDEFTLDVAALPSIDLDNPVETATEPLFFIPGFGQRGDARALVAAPYVVDRIGLGDRTQVWLGARLDYIDYEEDLSGLSRDDTEISPMGGVVFTPRSGVTLYASGGRAFAVPSTRVTGQRDPEESRQFEAGLKGNGLDGRLNAGVAGYYIERRDIAIPDANGITQTAGDQRSRGFEVELAAHPADGVRALVSYSFNDSELTEFRQLAQIGPLPTDVAVLDRSGNDPAFAPRHLARVWLAKTFESGLTVGGGMRWTGEQYIAEDNRFEIDGFATFDAHISYALAGWTWSLNLDNLFDEEYFTRGFGSSAVIPGEPVTVGGSARYRF